MSLKVKERIKVWGSETVWGETVSARAKKQNAKSKRQSQKRL